MDIYETIQKDVKTRHGHSVSTCWIAHVKELNGLKPKRAPNRTASGIRKVPCPDCARPLIEDSMQRMGMIRVFFRNNTVNIRPI